MFEVNNKNTKTTSMTAKAHMLRPEEIKKRC